jgi:hypothetical protein
LPRERGRAEARPSIRTSRLLVQTSIRGRQLEDRSRPYSKFCDFTCVRMSTRGNHFRAGCVVLQERICQEEAVLLTLRSRIVIAHGRNFAISNSWGCCCQECWL